uniref:inorganic diphosphatase n=1 Tax=Cacopsylla melanoneura TaxID=428564 RepID=A0A8D8X2J3_9HEMI
MAPVHLIFLLTSYVYVLKAEEEEELPRHVFSTDNLNPVNPENLTIETIEKGTPGTTDYRMFFKSQHGFISPMHDILLYANYDDKIYNMIVEIPKGTNAKMAISLGDPMNPLKQCTKDGKLVSVHLPHVLPHNGYIWNYGAFPNTWESSNETDSYSGLDGDGHLLDVIDIGDRVAKRGEILHVKVLGAIGLLDNGRIDYKIIAVNVNDPKAAKLNDIGDVEKHYPGYMKATLEWFKHSTKKPLAFNGELKDREYTSYIMTMSMMKWMLLSVGKLDNPGISLLNTISGNEGKISFDRANKTVNKL